jgi:integrase
MRLTDLLISKIGLPDKGQKTHFDDMLPGFGIRVSQGGTKSFVVMSGKDRKLRTLGKYPELGLKEARAFAKQVQSDAAFQIPRARALPSISFADAKKRFLADSELRTKPRTIEEYRRLLNRHFNLEAKLREITRSDIMQVIEKFKATPAERQHAFVAIRTMMNWCVKHGLLESSPVPRLSFSVQPRSRILSDDELRAVWQRAERTGYPHGRIVQLLILTGQRRSEIAGLRRIWIRDETIVFPIGFTKNKREHTIPLAALARQIIEALPSDTDFMFPSRLSDTAPFNGWSRCKWTFDKPLKITEYTLHDLRRTYSSNMARLGVPIHVTEKLLNHVSGTLSGVAAVYNRYTYLPEMRQAMEAHESHLHNLFEL